MSLNLSAVTAKKDSKFPPQKNIVPATYPARFVQIIDFGLQPQKPFAGKDKAPAHEIGLTYELVDEFMKDEDGKDIVDKPRWVSETLPVYGLNADKAKSTMRYLAIDPEQKYNGDFAQLLGAPCLVTIVNNKSGDKIYDNVAAISNMRPRDAANCPELKNPARLFSLDDPDLEVFNSFPKWIQDKIKGNLNYKGSLLEKRLGGAPKEEQPKEAPPWKEEDNNNPY
jgi:hypothetical protein